MDDVEILETLQQAAIVAVGESDMPELSIKFVGITFTPPDDQRYLELVFIPVNRNDDFWGDEKNYQGIFRMVLHWPNDGAGAYPPMNVLRSIAGYFTKDLALPKVQIRAKPDLTGVLEEGAELLLPASIRYQSFRQ